MAKDEAEKNESTVMMGRYRVRKRIGSGGMGAVYHAVDTELGREVALKVLSPELARQPAMLARFRSEALHASRLRHKNIVALYEFGEAKGIYFLVMEYVKGCDLHDFIDRKGKLPEVEARYFTMQACKALILAHEQGIVHRDIKPSNLLLTCEDRRPIVKLTDFGLAMAESEDDLKVTRAGSTVGTVDYIAPEQARNSRAADVRSDIYSLGCTLYHMLAGRPPFPDGELAERLLKHLESEPPDLRSLNDQVSEGMVAVVQRMLAKRPEDRYQTPAELYADLKKLPTLSVLKPREMLEALAGLEKVKSNRSSSGTFRKRPAPLSGESSFRQSSVPKSVAPFAQGQPFFGERVRPDMDEVSLAPGGPNWPLILALVSGLVLAGAAIIFLFLGLQTQWRTG